MGVKVTYANYKTLENDIFKDNEIAHSEEQKSLKAEVKKLTEEKTNLENRLLEAEDISDQWRIENEELKAKVKKLRANLEVAQEFKNEIEVATKTNVNGNGDGSLALNDKLAECE